MVFRLDCADLASEWVAFSHTNDSLKLTVDNLESLERDVSLCKETFTGHSCLNIFHDNILSCQVYRTENTKT